MAAVTICSHFGAPQNKVWDSLVGQTVKHLPAMWGTWVRSLGQENPLEKETATQSLLLAWEIPWAEEPGSPWGCRLGHD